MWEQKVMQEYLSYGGFILVPSPTKVILVVAPLVLLYSARAVYVVVDVRPVRVEEKEHAVFLRLS